jgi:hypothetical protein
MKFTLKDKTMKNLILAALTTLALTSTAGASGFAFTFSNLTYPPVEDVTVAKDCLAGTTTPTTCLPRR